MEFKVGDKVSFKDTAFPLNWVNCETVVRRCNNVLEITEMNPNGSFYFGKELQGWGYFKPERFKLAETHNKKEKEGNSMRNITELALVRELKALEEAKVVEVNELKAMDSTHIKIEKALKMIEKAIGRKGFDVTVSLSEETTGIFTRSAKAELIFSEETEAEIKEIREAYNERKALVKEKYNEINTVLDAMEYEDKKKILFNYGITDKNGMLK